MRTPWLGRRRAGAKQPPLCPSSTIPVKTLCNLVPRESRACCRHGVARLGQDVKIGRIGRFGRPTRVDFRADLVEPSLASQVLISPPGPCIKVWPAVTLAACCSSRGWSHDGAENSMKCKIGRRGAHRKLHNSGPAGVANMKNLGGPTLVHVLQQSSFLAGLVPCPMEIWYSQLGLKWQRQRSLAETAHTHYPISRLPWRTII